MKTFFHIGKGNRKTGPIPTTTSGKNTCPDACPLKEKGCYAAYSFLGSHWKKVSTGERGIEWREFLQQVKAFPKGQLWRMNQAGDLQGSNNIIDGQALADLIKANKGKNGFTYTHYPMTSGNAYAVQQANYEGFTVNASANNIEQAIEIREAHKLPTVTLLPVDAPNVQTVKGHKIVACPAEKSDKITCSNCALCADAKRGYIIGFRAHGTAKKTVNKIATVTKV